MMRFHVHVSVNELSESIRFYSSVFGAEPTVLRDDYAKWMIEDPRVNFAISSRDSRPGVNHLGFQVESDGELRNMRARLGKADASLVEQSGQACCYAKSTSTGLPILRALPGKPSTPWKASRSSELSAQPDCNLG